MKGFRNILVPLIAMVLISGLALNFNACTNRSPLEMNEIDENGNYIEQQYDEVNLKGKRIEHHLNEVSNYHPDEE